MSKANAERHSKQRRHFSTRGIAEKSKAGIYRGDMVTFHAVCVCCFKAQAVKEAERQLVSFALMVHIQYFQSDYLDLQDERRGLITLVERLF